MNINFQIPRKTLGTEASGRQESLRMPHLHELRELRGQHSDQAHPQATPGCALGHSARQQSGEVCRGNQTAAESLLPQSTHETSQVERCTTQGETSLQDVWKTGEQRNGWDAIYWIIEPFRRLCTFEEGNHSNCLCLSVCFMPICSCDSAPNQAVPAEYQQSH